MFYVQGKFNFFKSGRGRGVVPPSAPLATRLPYLDKTRIVVHGLDFVQQTEVIRRVIRRLNRVH